MNRSQFLSLAFLTGFAVQVGMSDGAPQSDFSGVPPGCGDPRTATASTTSPTTATTAPTTSPTPTTIAPTTSPTTTTTAPTTSPTTTTTETTPRTTTQKRRPYRPDFGLYFDNRGCKHKVLWWQNRPLTVSCSAECGRNNVTILTRKPCAVVTNPGGGAARFGTRACRVGTCSSGSCSPTRRQSICQVRQAIFHRNYH
ncbi:uncharacterized protein LOC142590274 isoform X4 [Dermacentor variabilis]|uniref:uncharacterized protein LOC142590274 isoform X4 n=1 Tax=Dermacentor variabilis TaxID=34621 RepID=UPI003F5AFBEB